MGTVAYTTLIITAIILFSMLLIDMPQKTNAPLPASEVSCILTLSTTTPTRTSPIIAPTPDTLKWGFYESSFDTQKIFDLEKNLGKSPDMIAVFVHWGNENKFPTYLDPVIKNRKKTLVIFWEATDYTVGTPDQPRFSYDAILRGDWDAYLKSFAADAKTYGAPVILIPFAEMNGDWFPWSGTKNGNSPEKEILAYRHVREIFADVQNVKFGWAGNNDSVPDTPENSLDKYYPGDEYVDYVGVDGFNFGDPWQTFDEMFAAPLTTLAKYKKPIYLFSFASAEGANKPEWITDAFTKQIPKYPKIAGWIWFNENKERDWRINSDPNSLAAFKAIL
jgi:endoglucanase